MFTPQDLRFNLCFLTHQNDVLLLLRRKEPNKDLWNGVGGHLENGETPYQSMLREIQEETGVKPESIQFGGILTWQGFAIPEGGTSPEGGTPPKGGLYIFTAEVPDKNVVENGEGHLVWHPRQFVFTSNQVVSNIHYFLPPVFAGAGPFQYHFQYEHNRMTARDVRVLPNLVNIHQPFLV